MLVSQVSNEDGLISVVAREGSEAYVVKNTVSVLQLALEAIEGGVGLTKTITRHGLGAPVDLARAHGEARIDLPIFHPDPAHMHLSGTGLTHLGSAAARDEMHAKAGKVAKTGKVAKSDMTDSMKMFQMGLEGGRPEAGAVGVQPEWFYKGNGLAAVAPGQALVSPGFALDGGEEPEIAGIYVIGGDGTPFRVGFALANEFSDHVSEQMNYLYLAHSKLRPCSFGPEILVGGLPGNIEGTSRIVRNGKTFWQKPFLSGEANMSHTIANLEHHHFKYDIFRHPGDIHIHMFGTATLSFADGVKTRSGDVFEIEAGPFGLALSNPLQVEPPRRAAVVIKSL